MEDGAYLAASVAFSQSPSPGDVYVAVRKSTIPEVVEGEGETTEPAPVYEDIRETGLVPETLCHNSKRSVLILRRLFPIFVSVRQSGELPETPVIGKILDRAAVNVRVLIQAATATWVGRCSLVSGLTSSVSVTG